MSNTIRSLKISTPGRICLFGEHQDYLMLPVIPCAISLRISVEGFRQEEKIIEIDLPDIGARETFTNNGFQKYDAERDYFKSVYNVLRRYGLSFNGGFQCRVHGNIPINAGTSSSSALIISWANFLASMSNQKKILTPNELAEIGYEAEVLEFSEPGGMMDQYSTAYGGIVFIEFLPKPRVEKISADLGEFVIGDSCEPKDTKKILARVKNRVLAIVSRLTVNYPDFSLLSATSASIGQFRSELSTSDYELLTGTIRNRDITYEAEELLAKKPLNHRRLGELLTEHQAILRDVLQISTAKIDTMLESALRAGAYGGKINGSGGGGCMFVYAPEHSAEIAAAIESAGGKAYVVKTDVGSRIESKEE